MKRLIILLSFLCSVAYAQDDQVILDGGLGILHSGEIGPQETKMLTLGLQETIYESLKDRITGGGWIDNYGDGKRSSALLSTQIGWEVNRNGFVMGLFTGPSVISSPDALLGGTLEFMEDLHLGIQDHNDYIGVMYRHLSSAGIYSPNIGRDVIGLEIRF